MIKTTIAKAFEEAIDETNHYLYLYRDEDTIFYVGRSYSPLNRLREHLGKERPWYPDAIGDLILEHLPLSRDWQMEMYTLEDCLPFISQSTLGFYQQNLHNAVFRSMVIETAEDDMIAHFRPCLNAINNTVTFNLDKEGEQPRTISISENLLAAGGFTVSEIARRLLSGMPPR